MRTGAEQNLVYSIVNSSRRSENSVGLFLVLLSAFFSFGVFTGWCIWGQ